MIKNKVLLFALLSLATTTLHAQWFTLKVAGGYAFPGLIKSEQLMGPKVDPSSPSIDALVPMSNIYESDSIPSMQNVYGSYGKGGNFTFSFGYMINPYIGVEMGVSYIKSATITATQRRELTLQSGVNFIPLGSYLNARIETNAWGLSLMPSLIIQAAKPGWKVYPYGRLGISLPVAGVLNHSVTIDLEDSAFVAVVDKDPYYLGENTDIKLKTQGTVSLGFNGSIGVAYRPVPYLAITAEVNGQYLVTRAKSTEITQWDTDGKSRLEERGIYRTQFTYVDQLNASSNNEEYNKNTDKTKPKQDLRQGAPFSNIGFNIGVTFMLSKQLVNANKTKPVVN